MILGGSPYPFVNSVKKTIKYTKGVKDIATSDNPKDLIRERLYNNINPRGYWNAPERLTTAVLLNEPDVTLSTLPQSTLDYYYKNVSEPRDVLWAKYLNIPNSKLHKTRYSLVPSKFRPSLGKQNIQYYKDPVLSYSGTDERILRNKRIANKRLIETGLNMTENSNVVSDILSRTLGDHTVGKGYDNNGSYISYYDNWDLAPFGNHAGDQSFNIGTPVPLYDRFYLDTMPGLNRDFVKGTHWLPQLNVIYNKNTKKLKTHWGNWW